MPSVPVNVCALLNIRVAIVGWTGAKAMPIQIRIVMTEKIFNNRDFFSISKPP
jgi:hypothetical protein